MANEPLTPREQALGSYMATLALDPAIKRRIDAAPGGVAKAGVIAEYVAADLKRILLLPAVRAATRVVGQNLENGIADFAEGLLSGLLNRRKPRR